MRWRLIAVGAALLTGLAAGVARADSVTATLSAVPNPIDEGQSTLFSLNLSSSPINNNNNGYYLTGYQNVIFYPGSVDAVPTSVSVPTYTTTDTPSINGIAQATFTYNEAGVFTGSVSGTAKTDKVSGNGNNHSPGTKPISASFQMTVREILPSIDSLTWTASTNIGVLNNFSVTAHDPRLVPEALAYAWDFNGDTTYDAFVQNPTYTYTSIGSYTGTLRVTEADDPTAVAFAHFNVQVDAAANPNDGTVPVPAAVWPGLGMLLSMGGVAAYRKRRAQ